MFDEVIVIGAGAIAFNCAKLLKGKEIELSFIDNRNDLAFSSQDFCDRNKITYKQLEKDKLTQSLTEVKNKVLIISASNRYLFPPEVLNKQNITVINYHSALLPKHPGRNAEAWAIYEGDNTGGITWHYVVPEIDAGPIVIQKQVPIESTTTSFSLLRQYSKLAYDAFSEIIDAVLNNSIHVVHQGNYERELIHFSWQKPNRGELDLSWEPIKMSMFLRAMDYGPLQTLGLPLIIYNSKKYKFPCYKIIKDVESGNTIKLDVEKSCCMIRNNGYLFTLGNLKEIKH